MRNYKNLSVWQKGIKISLTIYKLTKSFSKEELFGLTSQMRRSGVSIASNIAEGAGRGSNKEFSRFIDIALGSAAELDTQVIISHELEYLNNEYFIQITKKIEEIQKMLSGLKNKIQN